MNRNFALVRFMPGAEPRLPTSTEQLETASPPADVFETADAFVVKLDLPGASREGIRLTIEADTMSLQAIAGTRRPEGAKVLFSEIGQKEFRRTFTLGDGIGRDRTEAEFADGVLTVTLPKTLDVRPRTIPIH